MSPCISLLPWPAGFTAACWLPLFCGHTCAPIKQVKNQARRTGPHLLGSKGIKYQLTKSHALSLPFRWLSNSLPKAVESAARDALHTAHGGDLECAQMILHKCVLHFRLPAKYSVAFFTMANSSACSATWRLRRAFSTRSCSSTTLLSCERRALLLQLYSWLSWSPNCLAAAATQPFPPRTVTLPCTAVNTFAWFCLI